METVARASLTDAVWREVGLTRDESERFVEAAIGEMTAALAAGEKMTISNFASFVPRSKGARIARHPKTGEPALVRARRVVAFRPSQALREGVQAALAGGDR
ncbi:MAG: integration host factor subunit alpha [Defluviicoccus sp.]|nr:integration host factor subunit alpha [Defluviicoccus sp.]